MKPDFPAWPVHDNERRRGGRDKHLKPGSPALARMLVASIIEVTKP